MNVHCPKCGKTGQLEALSCGVANDNLITFNPGLDVVVPEGFRVVVFGWRSPYEHLCCATCGVAAERVQAG
jgi:hypothetical protein